MNYIVLVSIERMDFNGASRLGPVSVSSIKLMISDWNRYSIFYLSFEEQRQKIETNLGQYF